jgi:hypothetical protein
MDMPKMETGITPPSPHFATEGDLENRTVRISVDKHNPADDESPKFAHFSQDDIRSGSSDRLALAYW